MPRSFASFAVVGCLGAVATAGVAFSQSLFRLGSELQINARTSKAQAFAAVGMDLDGDFVVAWSSEDQDGSGLGVFARRFNAAGVGLDAEFQVNTFTKFDQRDPSVAADADGDFVVAWTSYGQDGSNYGVIARRFNASGVGLAVEFQVNSHTSSVQRLAAVAMDTDGDFVVAWDSGAQDGSGYGVFARRFNAAGGGLGAEFQVNAYTSYDQAYPAVGMDGGGDFVVAWSSYGQDGSFTGVFARRFNASGVGLGAEFQVNAYTALSQSNPTVGMDGGGGFVVAWQSDGEGGFLAGSDIFSRRFDAGGAGLGGEFRVNTFTLGIQELPAVRMEGGGDFLVVWQNSGGLSPNDDTVLAQRLDAMGVAIGGELQVSTYTPSYKGPPALGVDGDGDFVVAWSSDGQDGYGDGVFAQRFATLAILDIDGNGSTAALTDGLLVLRFLFGFTGATLTSGAVDVAGCTRCEAATIAGYLQTLI